MKTKQKINLRSTSQFRRKREEIGLSPYAVVFRGEKKTEKAFFKVMQFNNEILDEFELQSASDLSRLSVANRFNWLHVSGIHDVDRLRELAAEFKIPDNILSNILDPNIRPKLEYFKGGLLVCIKLMYKKDGQVELINENLSLLVLENTLISFREDIWQVFEPVRERIRKFNNKIRSSGTDYLAFALLDVVLDNYIFVLSNLGEKIEQLDDDMTIDPRKELLDRINVYKREINFMRKSILPAREMILSLNKSDSELLHEENKSHFRELQNNIHEAMELSESFREILFDQMSIYHTIVSTKLNDIMRTLTVFSVIFIPLTFVAGVYGMNFDFMPELHWKYGYFISLAVMLVLAIFMLIYFLRKKWF